MHFGITEKQTCCYIMLALSLKVLKIQPAKALKLAVIQQLLFSDFCQLSTGSRACQGKIMVNNMEHYQAILSIQMTTSSIHPPYS